MHRWLINRKEEAFIESFLATSRRRSWNSFDDGVITLGYTERVVEIPWMLSRYAGEEHVLDVGTSFALPVYVTSLKKMGIPDLNGVDITPGGHLGIAMTQADVRQMPFADGYFGLILCISTLEHIGRDGTPNAVADGDLAALREMGRVLTPTGRLLVSVPFGRAELHPWFRQYDVPGWAALIGEAGLKMVEQAFYLYSPVEGWKRVAGPDELRSVGYQADGATAATGLMCTSLVRDDRAR